MQQRNLTPHEQNTAKADGTYEQTYNTLPKHFAGFDYGFLDRNCIDDTPEKRRETFEQLYAEGGFRPWLGNYKDVLFNKESNDEAYKFWAERCRARIIDPKKKDLLAPLLENQHHTFGTKVRTPYIYTYMYEVLKKKTFYFSPLSNEKYEPNINPKNSDHPSNKTSTKSATRKT